MSITSYFWNIHICIDNGIAITLYNGDIKYKTYNKSLYFVYCLYHEIYILRVVLLICECFDSFFYSVS